MLLSQLNFASSFTLYSDILKGVISILISAVLVKDPKVCIAFRAIRLGLPKFTEAKPHKLYS